MLPRWSKQSLPSPLRHDGPVAREVGDADGCGRYGVLDETPDGLLCHECGRSFKHLGLHAYKAHGLTAAEYRDAHGLSRRGLVASDILATIADNARRTFPARAAFVTARDPAAANAAQLQAGSTISPAGLAAIRAAAARRRGSRRKGIVVTCQQCGVQFCPLIHPAKRRFCSRSCASRYNRRSLGNSGDS